MRTILQNCIALLLLTLSGHCWAQDTEFDTDMSRLGFDTEDLTDWSGEKKINIGMPSCAYVNITGIFKFPPKKTSDYKAWLEMYDGYGNYFKKRIIINLQGKSSTTWPKKGYKIDFCEDEWVGDKTPDIKFGNWVKQDSYHLKAYYLDFFRGTGAISYKVHDIILQGRGQYPWQRANLEDPNEDARCMPDGFPCIVYLNGEFYGIYSWQLKKNRKNMSMEKTEPLHIHLDGSLSAAYLFSSSYVHWTVFEVRNPKSLYTMDGKEYDGDNPKELMDETSEFYDLDTDKDKVKTAKQNTAKVKHSIEQLNRHYFEIKDLIASGASKDEIRAEVEKRFDVPSIIDYIIHNLLTNNLDGLVRNWQWFTYDGYKWYVMPYDLDATFGYHTNYLYIYPAANYANGFLTSRTWMNTGNPLKYVETYFREDIEQQYAKLRDQGLLTGESVASLFDTWYYAVGEDNYAREWQRWPDSPSQRETVANTNWKLIEPNNKLFLSLSAYSSATTYNEGDQCTYQARIWEATGTTKGVVPAASVGSPDSLGRIHAWVPEHIKYLDKWMKYTAPEVEKTSYSLTITPIGWATVCLPFSFEIPDGLELYKVTGTNRKNDKPALEAVTQTEANTPYLVKGDEGVYRLIGYLSDEVGPELVNGLLYGAFTAHAASEGEYTLQMHDGRPGFYKVTGDDNITLAPNNAWFVLGEEVDEPADAYYLDQLDIPDDVIVTVSAAGIGTYCSKYDLDFSQVEGLKAYVVVGYNTSRSSAIVSRVDAVPGMTGLVVMGDPNDYVVPVEPCGNDVTNMLVGTIEPVTIAPVENGLTNLVLSVKDGAYGFYSLAGERTIGANKAYLQLPTALFDDAANGIGVMLDDDEASGITELAADENAAGIYTVSGVRVRAPQKGIYIMNGHKLIVR